MLPSRHIITSLSLGGGMVFFTQSPLAGLLCFLSGVLVDTDHVIDYLINNGLKSFDIKDIYWTCVNMSREKEKSKIKKVYLIFHAWEIAILFWIGFLLSRNIYLLAMALGYTLHLIMDSMARAFHPLTYFITYRFRKSFKIIWLFHS